MLIGSLNSEAEEGLDLMRLEEVASSLDPSKPGASLSGAAAELSRTLAVNGTAEAVRSAAYCIAALQSVSATPEAVESFAQSTRERSAAAHDEFDRRLENSMEYLRKAFGSGQEPVSLLSGLLGCYSVVMYSRPDGPLYRYNDEMLSSGHDRRIEDALEGME